MQINQRITPAVLAAATGMLQPFIPELSPQSLVSALKGYRDGGSLETKDTRPLTRHEAAELLSVSLNTINRYMNFGILQRIKINGHTVRIDAQSVENLLKRGVGGTK